LTSATVLLLGLWGVGLIYAQPSDSLSVSGTVFEIGSDGAASLPVAAVEVELIEFIKVDGSPTRSPVGTAYTDPQGSYQFHPQHTGDYYVEVRKDGYRYSTPLFYGISVKLDQAHPTAMSAFTLMRTGASITGRVIDQDGQPVPDLKIVVQRPGPKIPGVIAGNDATAVTAADGTFTAADLEPGPHVIQLSSRAGYEARVEPHFSADGLKTIDQDFETTYWPGGTAQQTASIPVSPGAATAIGTIKIRKAPYYRVHVSVPYVECEAGEKWTFSAVYSGDVTFTRGDQIPCTNDFLVSNLRPGTYSFRLISSRLSRDAPAPRQWALASVVISNKNSDVTLRFEPEAQIYGRIVAVDGASLPAFDKIQVFARSEAGPSTAQPVSPDVEGKFVLTNLAFPRHRIIVQGLPPQYYVKEIRLNGEPLPDATATLAPAVNQVEIVIDDKPGAIAGTVIDGDKPVSGAMVRLFPKVLQAGNFAGNVRTDKEGRFQFNGLAPGEYRILALPSATGAQPAGYAEAATAESVAESVAQSVAQSVKVERGGTVTITLTPASPSH
jgi:hypothetical protein